MQKRVVVARVGHDDCVGVGVGNSGCFNQALLKRIDGDVAFAEIVAIAADGAAVATAERSALMSASERQSIC